MFLKIMAFPCLFCPSYEALVVKKQVAATPPHTAQTKTIKIFGVLMACSISISNYGERTHFPTILPPFLLQRFQALRVGNGAGRKVNHQILKQLIKEKSRNETHRPPKNYPRKLTKVPYEGGISKRKVGFQRLFFQGTRGVTLASPAKC